MIITSVTIKQDRNPTFNDLILIAKMILTSNINNVNIINIKSAYLIFENITYILLVTFFSHLTLPKTINNNRTEMLGIILNK